MILAGHKGQVSHVAYSTDGVLWPATGGADNTAKIWDAEKGEELLTLSGHTGNVRGVAWSPVLAVVWLQ